MTEEHTPYPVRVDAALDTPVSRWLWLVKWLLLIPHAVVLVFLWAAFLVVSVIAFVAILVTGRYPRALFDFNVGVLRWSWRVQYYGYAALGTDRYPPFTLADVPDYPARLHVPHPERLSRGLVLVKWWLLALPHYLVVAVFAGGGLWLSTWPRDGGNDDGWAFGGLIGLLVLVAAVVLLFTGRYPRQVWDFVLGMDRWVLRVAAYAALMTDRYPPFRLDMGGTDPGSPVLGPPPGPARTGQDVGTTAVPSGPVPAATGSTATDPVTHGMGDDSAHSRWTGGKVVALVLGAVLVLASTGPLTAGAALLWADRTQRDGGWLTSPTVEASTARHALVSEDLQLHTEGADWVLDEVLGRVRLEATPLDGEEVFVGVAPSAAVAEYLGGVGRTQVQELGAGPDRWGWGWGWDDDPVTGDRMDPAALRDLPGGPPAGDPGEVGIWAASAAGTGTQVLEWVPSDGDWTVVVMPTDGSAGMSVDLALAATAPALPWVAGGLLATGVVLLAGGVLLIALAVHRAQARPAPPAPGGPPAPPAGPGPAPAGTRPTPSGDPSLTPSGGPR
ncbi:DUF4389 domain-containing protein [Modestobacter sp. VKM Ac-2985]|uniref:DUF4389 domain-containing protein n=1 Tax=Modestobacter sp. VKM Ac-2985 TaxID=3004139 RepID=UPI0022ABBA67|nr:DUF4389 domain-containing protein [Modestobacter sp. VKM Ac-2985]MCZ2839145.1 DUF4389 domain-containing protein [Modestobacter sp. VKM Ac-2985]